MEDARDDGLPRMDAAAAAAAVQEIRREPWGRRAGRRALSVFAVALTLALVVTFAPVLVPAAIIVDLVRGTRLGATRTLALLVCILGFELVGIAAATWLWLGLKAGVLDRERFLERNFRLQCWWCARLVRAGAAIYQFRLECEHELTLGERPIVVFARHASLMDTVLPIFFLAGPHDIRLRYVLKRELLWDPCLDIVGQRLPNLFVARGIQDPARRRQEVAAVVQLASDLGPRDGVMIFPEGTRYTARKRQRLLSKLQRAAADGGPEDALALQRAEALARVLPPRPGGALSLLQRADRCDVVFMAHAGLERAASLRELCDGALVGGVISVRFWAVPGESIPPGSDARLRWLHEQWREVDRFVVAHHEARARDAS